MRDKRPGRRPRPTPEALAEFAAERKKSGMSRLAFIAKKMELSPEQIRIMKQFMVPDAADHPAGASAEANATPAAALKKKLPAAAPELWAARDLNLRENPSRFIKRVYSKWLGEALERSHLASLDPPLYKALSVWLTRNPDDPIAYLLPSKKRSTAELIDRLSAEYPLDELRKLGYAIDARMRRADKN